MPDRLSELRRQRALIQEHLAWLEREIAEASGKPLPLSANPPAPAQAVGVIATALKASASAPAPESPAVVAAAESILEEYRVPEASLKTDVRKGCILYFVTALALVAAAVVVLYFALRH